MVLTLKPLCRRCDGKGWYRMPDPAGRGEVADCPDCGAPKVTAVPAPAPQLPQIPPATAGSQYRGCICPPTAEQTCQGIGCPRRGWNYTAVTRAC